MSATTAPTMSAAALDHDRWALLNELASMLESVHDDVMEMRDSREAKWPDEDIRGQVNWINLTMEALDALGGKDTIDRPQAERDEKREGGES